MKSRKFKCNGEVKQSAQGMPGHCFTPLHWASTPTSGKQSITTREYNSNGRYVSKTISERFGDWSKALEKAGLTLKDNQLIVKHHQSVTNDELLIDLKKVAAELGKESITFTEYYKVGKYGSWTIRERFGSWNKALEEAGLIINKYHNIGIEVLFENIEQVWLKLGRQPGRRDMTFPLSKYGETTYRSNFGSWKNALTEFVKFINSEVVETEQTIETISEEIVIENTTQAKSEVVPQLKTKRNIKEQTVETSIEVAPRHKTKRDINQRLRFRVIMRDKCKCVACGRSPATNPEIILHVDHIFAWANGGETVYENLQTLCSVCNIGKSNIDFKVE